MQSISVNSMAFSISGKTLMQMAKRRFYPPVYA